MKMYPVFRLYVSLDLCRIFYQLCFLCVFGIAHYISLSNSERSSGFLPLLSQMNINEAIFTYSIFSRSDIIDELMGKSGENNRYCMKLYAHKTYDNGLEYQEKHDTLTVNDIVRAQYMKLPYPAISQRQLASEKLYYEKLYTA